MKRLFIILAALLAIVVPGAMAQSFTGMWEIIPNYTSPTRLVETPEYVYVLAGNGLCGYDKQTGEVVAYNTGHRLNGNLVTNIWYDGNERCLFVAYSDYNIDLVYDDGRTVNVPDLREAPITSVKTINDVAFYGGKAYVATASGMLVIDMEHGAIEESCLWGKNISHIAATDKHIVIQCWAKPVLIASRAGSHHSYNDSFKELIKEGYFSRGFKGIGTNTILGQASAVVNALTISDEGALASNIKLVEDANKDKFNIQPTLDGATFSGNGHIYYVDKMGKITKTVNVADASGKLTADWTGKGEKIWIADANGFGQYDVASSQYAIAPVKPTSTSGANVGHFSLAADGSLYMSTVARGHSTVNPSGSTVAHFDRILVEGSIVPTNPASSAYSIFSISCNPKNADEFVAASSNGLYRISKGSDGKYALTTYNSSNSGLRSSTVNDAVFDSKGNLFVANRTNSPNTIHLIYISADKWNGTPAKADWTTISCQADYGGNHSNRISLDETNSIAVITAGDKGLVAANYATKSTTVMPYSIDEDGMSLGGWIAPAIKIDKKGWIWVGNDAGLYVIRDARQLFNPGFVPMRPKVPRNDGTNLADFLLENVEVYTIHVDESDQKWIGTVGSGLYRVSADGTQILDHFTTDNSDIPSDNVLAIHTDGTTNRVFIGTNQGLCIYHATSAPASSNYDNVYAYPNPVTPDYTGWITITGLMDNSTVKIADTSGRVFFEGKSDGGLATWNGCDASGNRVKSGVYFVFASRTAEGTSSNAAVTKIVVIN